jgi:argininosuccinate synthase
MLACGASDAKIVDGQEALALAGLKVIQSQAKYEGGYWNTTGIARPVTVEKILCEFNKEEIGILFHGATGRGNDQVRFQLATNMIDPEIHVYAPWRDQEFLDMFPGRQEMIEYCESQSLPIRSAQDSRYSTDANFLGLTHEAGDLEDVTISPDFVEPGMGVWPWDSPDIPEYITLKWLQGVPVEVGGESLPLVAVFKRCNEISGRHGIGIGTHVIENRFVGIKSRGIYESPGMELLGKSYEFLLQFILDRRAREYYEDISTLISRQIYQGYWLDSATAAAIAALKVFSDMATGTIQVKLYKGNIFFEMADDTPSAMPNSLYTDDGSMEAEGTYDHKDAEGFLNVLGVSARNFGIKQYKSHDGGL